MTPDWLTGLTVEPGAMSVTVEVGDVGPLDLAHLLIDISGQGCTSLTGADVSGNTITLRFAKKQGEPTPPSPAG